MSGAAKRSAVSLRAPVDSAELTFVQAALSWLQQRSLCLPCINCSAACACLAWSRHHDRGLAIICMPMSTAACHRYTVASGAVQRDAAALGSFEVEAGPWLWQCAPHRCDYAVCPGGHSRSWAAGCATLSWCPAAVVAQLPGQRFRCCGRVPCCAPCQWALTDAGSQHAPASPLCTSSQLRAARLAETGSTLTQIRLLCPLHKISMHFCGG